MANHESAIKDAIKKGDQTKVNQAYASYVANMTEGGQRPRPLSYFTN